MDRHGLTENCWCAHDKSSHYLDKGRATPSRMTCLARGCECTHYVNDRDPKPWKRGRLDTMPGVGEQ